MPQADANNYSPITIQRPSFNEINYLDRRAWEERGEFLLILAPAAKSDSQQIESNLTVERFKPLPPSSMQEVGTNSKLSSIRAAQHIRDHPLTQKLFKLNFTNEELGKLRFRGSTEGLPFDLWPFIWTRSHPYEFFSLMRAYCALKWLILDNPPSSRETVDAWRCITEVMNEPIFEMAERYRSAQKRRATKPRGKLPESKKTIGEVIRELSQQPRHRGENAIELWPHLFAELSERGLHPKELDNRHASKAAYTYDGNKGRKKMGFRRFANLLSGFRRRKRSR